MKKKIDLYIFKTDKITLENIKKSTGSSYSNLIKNVLIHYLNSPVELIPIVVKNNWHKFNKDNITTITISHKYLIDLTYWKNMSYALKSQYPDITFKKLILFLIHEYLKVNYN